MEGQLVAQKENDRDDTIECLTCYKQLPGKTQYKIHLTTPQHLKREDAKHINDLGPPPRQLPEWADILQYLTYLQLDEPIIGLDSLVQQEDTIIDGKRYLNYKCKMCNIEGLMCSMVSHIVSRRHRHRYLQLRRPDLLTQSKSMGQKQPGIVARAKAAIVEKQDGWGTPSAIREPKVKYRPVTRSMVKPANQAGPKATQGSNSHTTETSSQGQDWRGQAHSAIDGYRKPDFSDNVFGKPSQFHGNDKNDRPRGEAAHWQAYPKTDQPKNAYYQDGRQRPYQSEGYKEKIPYLEGDGSVRSFVEGDGSGRHHPDKAIPGSSYRGEHQDEYYREMDPRRGWNSSGVVQQDLYHGGVARNRFTDTERSGSAQHPEELFGQVHGQMYASRDGRGHSMEEMQRPSSSFQSKEKERDYLQDMIKEARAGTYEMQDYAKRAGMGNYAQEYVPPKKKRQSRFSDATPKEVELAQRRFKEGIPPMTQHRGPVQVFEERNALDTVHTTVNSENVLDVLDGVQIDSAEEANFLKQKLCDVLKQFHANKSQRAEVSPSVREYSPRSEVWMDQRRSVQETRDFCGFQETTRYDRRDFTNDSTGVQETWRPEKNTRDVQDPRCVEDQRYENRSTDFQESRRYEDSHADFPQARRFEDNPSDFQRIGQFGDNRMAFQQERGSYDNSRDVQRAERFEDNLSSYQQASSFKDSSRAVHVEEDPRSFQSMRHIGGTEENRSYEQQFEGEVSGRHGDRDFRRIRSDLDTQHEFEWDAQRKRSAGRSDEFKDYHPDVERRAYQEGHWKTRSGREDQAYGENQAHMPHYQHNVDPSMELYDPFHPSPSPPPQPAPPPSSLEKLASTLLELVSRNSN